MPNQFGIEIVEPTIQPTQEPVTPPGADVQEEQVSLSQAKLDSIIREAQGRAAKALREENTRLKSELAAAPKVPAMQPTEDLTVQLMTTRAELASLKAAQQESALKEQLRAAVAGQNFFEPELACQILRTQVKIVGGKPVPVDADGNERLGSDFNPLGIAELAAELARTKKFLVRGDVKPGSGSKPTNTSFSDAVPLERLFGPKSDGGLAQKLAMTNPAHYRRLRAAAKARGLC